MVQWLRLYTFTAKGQGSIPGQGTKIPQATWCGQKKNKKQMSQGYSNQNNVVLAQKQTHRSMEQNKEPRNKPKYIWSINLQQRRWKYAVGKDSLSVSGAGKNGQLHVKEWN